MFIMTSGLRSVSDKAITYFKEVLEERDSTFYKLYTAVNAFGTQVRRSLSFNLFAIVGGQLENDDEHKLFLLYPEGNWVEVGGRFTIYHCWKFRLRKTAFIPKS